MAHRRAKLTRARPAAAGRSDPRRRDGRGPRGGHGRGEPPDGLEVAAAVRGRGRGRPRGPDARGRIARRGPSRRSRSTRSSPPATPTGSDRTAWRPLVGVPALDDRRRARPPRPLAARRPGPTLGCPDPLRPRAPGRAAPHRRQEAGPDPRRRWSPLPRPGDRDAAGPGAGYDYLHVAVDDMSRVAFVPPFRDERGTTCARFLLDAAAFFAGHGVRIERVLTDNAKNYTDVPGLRGGPRGDRRPPQADPALPAPDQRQGRALQQDPARRVGLRPPATRRTRRGSTPSRPGSPTTTRADPTVHSTAVTPMTVLVNNVSGNHS